MTIRKFTELFISVNLNFGECVINQRDPLDDYLLHQIGFLFLAYFRPI